MSTIFHTFEYQHMGYLSSFLSPYVIPRIYNGFIAQALFVYPGLARSLSVSLHLDQPRMPLSHSSIATSHACRGYRLLMPGYNYCLVPIGSSIHIYVIFVFFYPLFIILLVTRLSSIPPISLEFFIHSLIMYHTSSKFMVLWFLKRLT